MPAPLATPASDLPLGALALERAAVASTGGQRLDALWLSRLHGPDREANHQQGQNGERDSPRERLHVERAGPESRSLRQFNGP